MFYRNNKKLRILKNINNNTSYKTNFGCLCFVVEQNDIKKETKTYFFKKKKFFLVAIIYYVLSLFSLA